MTRRYLLWLLTPVALLGLVAGWRVSQLTEGRMIARAGAAWAAGGGDPADCHALPAPEPAWIAVICGSGRTGRLYQFDRLGRIAVSPLADPADAMRPVT